MTVDYLKAIAAHDIGDAMDLFSDGVTQKIWAKSFGPALADPVGDPSPAVSALRAASLSQEPQGSRGTAEQAPRSDNGD